MVSVTEIELPTDQMEISVIIPTLGEKSRESRIKKCVKSIRESSREKIQIIAVVNGNRHDSSVCDWLRAQSDIVLATIDTPSSPGALLHGRALVDTPFFSTLDDDDEYLPASSDIKLATLKAKPEADLIVTNGFRRQGDKDIVVFENFSSVADDPLTSLFRIGWLNSCNSLYRSSSVGLHYFSDFHPYVEWTWLAYKLAMDKKKIIALDAPCVRINVTPGSLSDSDAYRIAYIGLFERMLALRPPANVARLIRYQIGAAWHDRSTRALDHGARGEALLSHLRSLLLPGRLRYLSYTRHLIPGWPRK